MSENTDLIDVDYRSSQPCTPHEQMKPAMINYDLGKELVKNSEEISKNPFNPAFEGSYGSSTRVDTKNTPRGV